MMADTAVLTADAPPTEPAGPRLEEAPRTHLRSEEVPDDQRVAARVAQGITKEAALTLLGAVASGVGGALILSLGLGIVPVAWTVVIGYAGFLISYTLLVFLGNPGPAVRDRFWTVVLWSVGVVVVGSLALVIGFTVIRGGNVFSQIFSADSGQSIWQRLHFFTTDMTGVGPLSGLDVGGILHAIVGTLVQIGIALLITVPFGLLTAVFLGEVGGRFARFVRTIVEAMTALPSVVAGLFIYAALIATHVLPFSGFAAALSITVLMLPIMIRSSDVVLRLVPGNLREAGLALGAGQWRVVWHVVLPTVRSGLVTAIILATAHGIGETAPVLLTSGLTSYLNFNPFRDPMTSLPLAALEFVRNSQQAIIARGFATAATLLLLVLVLFVLARIIGGRGDQSRSGGARASRRIADRYRRRLARAAAAADAPNPTPFASDPEDAPA